MAAFEHPAPGRPEEDDRQGEDERDEYFALTPKAQRDWILGRIAVKDAVRDVLWQRGVRPATAGRRIGTGPLETTTTDEGERV